MENLKGAPIKIDAPYIWALPVCGGGGGGGLNACPDGLGHLFGEELYNPAEWTKKKCPRVPG